MDHDLVEFRPFTHSRQDYIELLKTALSKPAGYGITFDDLMERVERIWEDDHARFVYDRVFLFAGLERGHRSRDARYQSFDLFPPPQDRQLADALIRLRDSVADLAPRHRHRADQAISVLTRVLPASMAWEVVRPWMVDRPRTYRKSVLFRILFEHGVPDEHAETVAGWVRDDPSKRMIELASMNPNVCRFLTLDDVLSYLEVPIHESASVVGRRKIRGVLYWRMRMVSAYLTGGHDFEENVAMSYPLEYLWAAGHGMHRQCAANVRKLLAVNDDQPEYLWRALRALERIGSEGNVALARELARRLVEREG